MIRDDFKDTKKVASKEARKKASMGERNYYATRANKLRDLTQALNFTHKFTAILFSVLYALILLVFIITLNTDNPFGDVRFIIWSAIYVAFMIWVAIWYKVVKPRNENEAKRCTKELERLSMQNLTKISNAYKIYGDDYIAKLKKEQEETAKKFTAKESDGETAVKNAEN